MFVLCIYKIVSNFYRVSETFENNVKTNIVIIIIYICVAAVIAVVLSLPSQHGHFCSIVS